MKTSKITVSLITAILALTFACKKDKQYLQDSFSSQNPTNTFNTADKQKLLQDLASQEQLFTIDANITTRISGTKGTRIIFSPSAFVTQSNQPVIGNINVKLKEALTKKDMILNNAVPVSNGNLLVSGGEIYLSAWQNGQKLKKNPSFNGININIPISGTPDSQMGLFYAEGGSDLSNGSLNWTLSNDTVSVIQDTSASNGWTPELFYNYSPDSLNTDSIYWANCDYFWNDPNPKTTLTFTLTGQFNNSNTVVYLSLNGKNVLTYIYSDSYIKITQSFSSSNIPINSSFTIVAVAYTGGNYYYYSMPLTTSPNLGVSIPPLTLSSLSQINNALNSLP